MWHHTVAKEHAKPPRLRLGCVSGVCTAVFQSLNAMTSYPTVLAYGFLLYTEVASSFSQRGKKCVWLKQFKLNNIRSFQQPKLFNLNHFVMKTHRGISVVCGSLVVCRERDVEQHVGVVEWQIYGHIRTTNTNSMWFFFFLTKWRVRITAVISSESLWVNCWGVVTVKKEASAVI